MSGLYPSFGSLLPTADTCKIIETRKGWTHKDPRESKYQVIPELSKT